jgi:hypothetical protein
MPARTFFSAVTALAIAFGAVAAWAGAASAKDWHHKDKDWSHQDQDWGKPGKDWDDDWNKPGKPHKKGGVKPGFYVTRVVYIPREKCTPVYEKAVWYDKWNNPHWYQVQVDTKCKTVWSKEYKQVWVPFIKYPNHKLEFRYAY